MRWLIPPIPFVFGFRVARRPDVSADKSGMHLAVMPERREPELVVGVLSLRILCRRRGKEGRSARRFPGFRSVHVENQWNPGMIQNARREDDIAEHPSAVNFHAGLA